MNEVERLVQAGARFLRARPWVALEEEAPFALDAPGAGLEGACLVVTGAEGDAPGLALYETLEGYFAALDAAESDDGPPGRALFVAWEEPGSPPSLVAWEEGAQRDLVEDDWRLAAACAEAVVDLLERWPDLPDEEVELRQRSAHEGLPEVELVLPHPELGGPEDELIEAFVEAELDLGHDGVLAENLAAHAVDFQIAQEAEPDVWTAADVESFLLLHVPRKVALGEAELERLPDAFCRFLRFVAEACESMDEKRVERLCSHVDELRGRYRLAVTAPERWGPAKTLLMRAFERGIDPTDGAAMEQLAGELAAEPRQPARQGPKVGRNDPCPCGSGKKHKKCCDA